MSGPCYSQSWDQSQGQARGNCSTQATQLYTGRPIKPAHVPPRLRASAKRRSIEAFRSSEAVRRPAQQHRSRGLTTLLRFRYGIKRFRTRGAVAVEAIGDHRKMVSRMV